MVDLVVDRDTDSWICDVCWGGDGLNGVLNCKYVMVVDGGDIGICQDCAKDISQLYQLMNKMKLK